MKVDLHSHTYFSDGAISPKELIDLAIERKVKYLAITDHDTVRAIPEAIEYCEDKDINFIPGIEASAMDTVSGDSIHLVGLYIDHENEQLLQTCEDIHKKKRQGFIRKIDYINSKLGIDIDIEKIKGRSHGKATFIHIAMELVERGIYPNIGLAVKSFLKGGDLYESYKINLFLDAKEVIRIIHDAGGLAILAHPAKYKNHNKFVTEIEKEDLIKRLKSYGLDGLEVCISDSSPEDIEIIRKLAVKYDLKISTGSDFHCEKTKPLAKLGGLNVLKKDVSVLK